MEISGLYLILCKVTKIYWGGMTVYRFFRTFAVSTTLHNKALLVRQSIKFRLKKQNPIA